MNLLLRSCIVVSLASVPAFAGPIGGAIQGSLYTPGGGPVTSSHVTFKVQVMASKRDQPKSSESSTVLIDF